MQRLFRLLILASVITFNLLFPPVYGQSFSKPDLVLTILHTNDLHAHEDSFLENGRTLGGAARLTYLIRAIRAKTPNVLTIDAGDIFQGTAYFKFYSGATEVAYLNNAGYDIYTIGNHEFDNGSDNLAKQLQAAKFSIISANIDASAKPELAKLIKPSTIRTIEGKRVGFVGAVTPDLEKISLTTDGVRIKESGEPTAWVKPIADEVEHLQKQGVDKIILVTHCGVDRDKILAENIPAVDAIIGGHSHTRLNRPVVIQRADGTSCTIVQTGCFGRTLGKLRLSFDSKGQVITPATKYSLISITDKLGESPDVKKYLGSKSQPILALRNNILGFALAGFDNRSSGLPADTGMGNLVADAVFESGSKYGATIAFHNRGGIRGRIDQGPISLEKVEEVLPFNNSVVVATISGATITRVLEHALSNNPSGKFLNVHGLKVTYDPNKPNGQRIASLLVEAGPGNWKPIDAAKNYRVAINDYNFSGGEGFDFAGATDIQSTKLRLADALVAYLKKHPKISPLSAVRVTPVESAISDNHFVPSKGRSNIKGAVN